MSGAGANEDALRGWRDVARPALASVFLILPLGALAVLAREPLLFPSLGPTIFIQVHAPKSKAARPWNNVAGHALGVLAAVIALWVTGAVHDPSATSAALTWGRALASALAVALSTAAQIPLRAAHPPAAATTLLITLGAVACDPHAIGVLFAGVLLTVVLERLVRPWLLSS